MESNPSCLLVCSQLLGFVYACYVVSAITEEEDSCESLNLTLINTQKHTHSKITDESSVVAPNDSHLDPLTQMRRGITGVEENKAPCFFISLSSSFSRTVTAPTLPFFPPSSLLPHTSWAPSLSLPSEPKGAMCSLSTPPSGILLVSRVASSLLLVALCGPLRCCKEKKKTPLMFSGFHFSHFLLSVCPLPSVAPAVLFAWLGLCFFFFLCCRIAPPPLPCSNSHTHLPSSLPAVPAASQTCTSSLWSGSSACYLGALARCRRLLAPLLNLLTRSQMRARTQRGRRRWGAGGGGGGAGIVKWVVREDGETGEETLVINDPAAVTS